MSWRMWYSAVFAKEAESVKGTQREQFLLVPWCSLPEAEQEVGMSYSFLNTSPSVPPCQDRYPEFCPLRLKAAIWFSRVLWGTFVRQMCVFPLSVFLFKTMMEFEGRIANPQINLPYMATPEWPFPTNLPFQKPTDSYSLTKYWTMKVTICLQAKYIFSFWPFVKYMNSKQNVVSSKSAGKH